MPPTPDDKIRPRLEVTPEILKLHTMEEYTRLLELFYLQFRRQETFDNLNSDKPRASLYEIFSCYVDQFNQTLEHANKYPHVLQMKPNETLQEKPLPWSLFSSFVHECHHQYMIKIRPTLSVTPEMVKSHTMEEYKKLVGIFYLQFRRQETFDNLNSDKPRAPLDTIFSRYLDEFNKTLEHAMENPYVLQMKPFERLQLKPLSLSLFRSFLYECDYQYIMKDYKTETPSETKQRNLNEAYAETIAHNDRDGKYRGGFTFKQHEHRPSPVVSLHRQKHF
jgi:hypothetical protein